VVGRISSVQGGSDNAVPERHITLILKDQRADQSQGWAGEFGQHRTVITAHSLRDALTRTVLGRPLEIIATEAIGCYIERPG